STSSSPRPPTSRSPTEWRPCSSSTTTDSQPDSGVGEFPWVSGGGTNGSASSRRHVCNGHCHWGGIGDRGSRRDCSTRGGGRCFAAVGGEPGARSPGSRRQPLVRVARRSHRALL